MKNLLGGITEPVYENIFAIGLNELQELATLDGEEVARYIYGISLGPDGERILKAYNNSEVDSKHLFDETKKDGHLLKLVARPGCRRSRAGQPRRPVSQVR